MIRSLFLTFIPDADQNTAKVSVVFNKSSQSGAKVIRTRGIAVGVVGSNAGVGFLQGDKMGAQSEILFPVVK